MATHAAAVAFVRHLGAVTPASLRRLAARPPLTAYRTLNGGGVIPASHRAQNRLRIEAPHGSARLVTRCTAVVRRAAAHPVAPVLAGYGRAASGRVFVVGFVYRARGSARYMIWAWGEPACSSRPQLFVSGRL